MHPKTIVTVICDDFEWKDLLVAAQSVAQSLDAHLDVIALAVDRNQMSLNYTDISGAAIQVSLAAAQQSANELASEAEAMLANSDVRYAVQPFVSPLGTAGMSLGHALRFSDLAVQAMPYGKGGSPTAVDIVEVALFNAHLPTLILPHGATSWSQPRRAILGWNESDAALTAARAAIPVLVECDTTFLTVIDPPRHGPDRSDPGGMLGQMLARHGVRCEVDVLAQSMPRLSDVLQRQIRDRNADLLVMGAYGRARWSEAMFGGATRDMLEECPVPVLMAH